RGPEERRSERPPFFDGMSIGKSQSNPCAGDGGSCASSAHAKGATCAPFRKSAPIRLLRKAELSLTPFLFFATPFLRFETRPQRNVPATGVSSDVVGHLST